MYYIGFDLGDGESSLAYFDSDDPSVKPQPIPILQSCSFPTAVATMKETGRTVIGSNAIANAPNQEDLRVCFKRDFVKGSTEVSESFRRFISAVIEELKKAKLPFDPLNKDECRFVVGQPADWDKETLQNYRFLLESCGIKDPYMTSESRAALVYLHSNKHLKIQHDLSSSNTLVCDFGSSTLDFAYSVKGDSSNVTIFGDPRLGGGLMDEQIVLESIAEIEDEDKRKAVKDLFDTKKEIRARLMIEARRLKEEFFKDPNMTPLAMGVPVFRQGVMAIRIRVDAEIIGRVIMYPQPLLNNNSMFQQLQDQFTKAVKITKENPPEIIVLTGGASRMGFFQDICSSTFQKLQPEIIISDEPETDIANGLALDGCYAEKLEQLKKDLQKYVDGSNVEEVVKEEMPALILNIANGMINNMISNDSQEPGAIVAAFHKWKESDTSLSIEDMKGMVENSVKDYCETTDFHNSINNIVGEWMGTVLPRIQSDLDRICIGLNLTPAHVSLEKIKFTEDLNIEGTVFHPGTGPIDAIDAVIIAITALIVGSLAGGGGIALICAGPLGVIIGVLLVLGARFAFGNKLKDEVMHMKLPNFIRGNFSDNSVFDEKSIRKMKLSFADCLLQEAAMKESICEMLSNHVDAIILAVSSQTRV